ncbi:MAG TPA: hypothetical protein PLF30_03735 [Candidatus Moranbacteria bacterium]|jgi:hypothetical protein|nr:hypothetical protein [Candidatus Moranbacteria bacterium]HOF42940.1 hypothetical protein [Candidatus Moranbacteria bacterium]HPX94638.1 hypothetical protein [Candidatus Moranbacteria bacterium]HQB59781.1 hypothetical protein [Candidatus Moranbacteria bacterium]
MDIILKNKIPVIILAIAAISVAIWGFIVFKERNAGLKNATENNIQQEISSEEADFEENLEEFSDIEEEEEDVDLDFDEESRDKLDETEDEEYIEEEKTNLTEVFPEDCENLCKDFKNSEEKEYCRQICGLSENNKKSDKKDCSSLSGLEKDYCLKDLAVKKTDFKICEEIEDSGILKTCRNRIAEDILDPPSK